MVPLQVVLDGVSAPEAVDGDSARESVGFKTNYTTGFQVAGALRAGRIVTTSRPTLEAFSSAYRAAAEDGADAVVSVHLSRSISGTYEAAVAAARDAPLAVTVIDSGTVAMALGFAALDGAVAAAEDLSVADVVTAVERRAESSVAFFCVDSLEHLRRGGRIGAARALLASALAVKPLLTVADGVIKPYERVRTRAKAVSRLEQLSCEAAVRSSEASRVDLAAHHVDDVHAAEELAARLEASLRQRSVEIGEVVVSEVSAVLGVHVGPGTLGVVVAPRVG